MENIFQRELLYFGKKGERAIFFCVQFFFQPCPFYSLMTHPITVVEEESKATHSQTEREGEQPDEA